MLVKNQITNSIINYNTNNNQRSNYENQHNSLESRTPSFKGKESLVKTFFAKFLELLKTDKKTQKQELVDSIENRAFKFIKKKELPFDGEARLLRSGFEPKNIPAFLKQANGSQDHYMKMIRMKKAGFEEELIPKIFQAEKNYMGQLSVPLYNRAFKLKDEGIEQKFIPDILRNFRKSAKHFDEKRFNDFQMLRMQASAFSYFPPVAFDGIPVSKIDEFFYTQIPQIEQTKKLLGEKNFLKLYNLEFDYLSMIVERTPKLLETTGINTKLYKLLQQKIAPSISEFENNSALFERKEYSPQAMTDFHDRISTLLELMDIAESKRIGDNSTNIKEMIRVLNKLH